jgi:phage replication-related protein YjqB (UPF0714/DUF867 family)
MIPFHLNKILILVLFFSLNAAADEFHCSQAIFRSHTTAKNETLAVCYLKDEKYFISENCKNLDCNMVKELRDQKIIYSQKDRPGVTICKAVGGVVEAVSINGVSTKRCLSPKDHTSISFNLLESWDGKKFHGPSESFDF